MNISGVSSTNSPYDYQTQIQSSFKQRAEDFKSLESALQSGDLSGAQQAFATLTQDGRPVQQAGSAGKSGNGQAATDFQALQTALQSNDLAEAQKAFSTLKQDIQ